MQGETAWKEFFLIYVNFVRCINASDTFLIYKIKIKCVVKVQFFLSHKAGFEKVKMFAEQ